MGCKLRDYKYKHKFSKTYLQVGQLESIVIIWDRTLWGNSIHSPPFKKRVLWLERVEEGLILFQWIYIPDVKHIYRWAIWKVQCLYDTEHYGGGGGGQCQTSTPSPSTLKRVLWLERVWGVFCLCQWIYIPDVFEDMKSLQTLWFKISSVESQKGAITIQRCSIENQKGTITIQRCSIENQKGAITIQRCSVENQKGAITIQRCSIENQKGIITIQRCSIENQKGTITIQRCSIENQKGIITIQ